MSMISRALVALTITIASICNGHSVELPSLGEILDKCRSDISRLTYLGYSVKGFPSGSESARLQLSWREEGNRCKYDFIEFGDSGVQRFSSSYSYDGERSLRTFRGDGILFAQKAPWDIPPWIRNIEFITSPYEFLLRSPGIDGWKQPNLELLKSEQLWKRLMGEAEVLGRESFNGRECVAVKFNKGTHRFIEGLSTYYIAYLDPNLGYTPIAWKQFNQKNQLLSELEVIEEQKAAVSKGVEAILPKKIKVLYYAVSDVEVFEKPTAFWNFEFSNLSLTPASDEDFSLDPASARKIFDEDEEIWITVPK